LNRDKSRFLPKVCRPPAGRRRKPAKSVPTSRARGEVLAPSHQNPSVRPPPALFHRDETATGINLDFVRGEPGVGGKFPPEPRGDHGIACLHQRAASLSRISGSVATNPSKSGCSSSDFHRLHRREFLRRFPIQREMPATGAERERSRGRRTFCPPTSSTGPDVFRQTFFQCLDVKADFSRRHGLFDVHPITLLKIVRGVACKMSLTCREICCQSSAGRPIP